VSRSSLFRRRCCHECGTVVDSGEATVTRGNLTLDRALRRATWRGQPVRLSALHFQVVVLLVQRAGLLVQNWAFFVAVFDDDIEDGQLAVQLCRVRKAFRAVDPDFDAIENVHGEGFRWRAL
jgi:DNA-binding response OmpR family regulator